MIIKILGTGAETTKPPKSYLGKYKPSCLIISPPVTILIDVGKDILEKATKEELLDVTHVLISHFHSDAVDGIPTFNKFLEENNKTVELYALPQVFERIKLRWSEKSYSNYLFVPIGTKKPFKIVDHTIKALKVFHDPRFPTVAYNIDNVFVYMSDGGPIWDEYELKYFSNNILAILDGAYWDHQIPLNNHVAVLEHLDFILSLNNKYTLFTGMGNQWPEFSKANKILKERLKKYKKEHPNCKIVEIRTAKEGEKLLIDLNKLYSQRDEFVLKPGFDTILNNPDILRKISKKELLMVHLRCHQLWAIKKTNKVLQVHVLVVKEMFRRGLKHRVINDLDKKTYRILGREIKVYEIWNELQDEIVIKSNIVRFVGSSLHKSDPNDLDIISPEVIYKAIKQFLKKYNPHYIGNEISHGDVLNVYDLILKKKDSPNIVNPRLPDYTKFYKSCKIIPKLPFKSDTYVIEPLIKGKHGIVVDKKNRLIYEHVITDNNKEIITDLLAYRSDNLFKEIIINRLLFMHKKWLNKADRPFYLPIRWIVKKSKLWSFLSSIKNKYDAVIIRPATFRYYDGKFILHFKKEKFCCECLDCGYKMISDNHCKDIKCPRCNGEMRRCDRPGVGKSIQKDKKLKPLMRFPPLKATASSYHELEYFDPEEAWEYFCKFYVEQEGKVRAEYKIDGFRMIASQDANKKSLIYFEDAMKDVSSKLPSLVKELSTLHDSGIILDGELMEWDPNKNRWLSRHDLMKWSQAKKPGSDENVRVFVFDILYYNGEDLHNKPLSERLKVLKEVSKKFKKHFVLCPGFDIKTKEQLVKKFNYLKHHLGSYRLGGLNGIDGLMIKAYSGVYELDGKTMTWVKAKYSYEADTIVLEVHKVKNKNVYNYTVGYGIPQDKKDLFTPIKELNGKWYGVLGKTFNTEIKAEVGQILNIAATEYKKEKVNSKIRYTLFQSRVITLKPNKKEPDSYLVIDRMSVEKAQSFYEALLKADDLGQITSPHGDPLPWPVSTEPTKPSKEKPKYVYRCEKCDYTIDSDEELPNNLICPICGGKLQRVKADKINSYTIINRAPLCELLISKGGIEMKKEIQLPQGMGSKSLLDRVLEKILGVDVFGQTRLDIQIPFYKVALYSKGLKNAVKEKEVKIINLKYNETYVPATYELLEVGRDTKERLLVSGFIIVKDTVPLVIHFYPAFDCQKLVIYGRDKDYSFIDSFVKDIHRFVNNNNPWKNEKITPFGKFLPLSSIDSNKIILDKSTLQKLNDTVFSFFNHKEKYEKANIPFKRGVIFSGVPGTGKTLSGKIIMNTVKNATFIWVTATDFMHLKTSYLFDMARELQPSILFIEDIDRCLQGPTLDTIKTQMDGLVPNEGILTILTTNFPERLPKTLIDRPGRFDDIIEFKLPDAVLRFKILWRYSENIDIENKKKSLACIARISEGLTPAHLKEVIVRSFLLSNGKKVTLELLKQSLREIKNLHDKFSFNKSFDKEISGYPYILKTIKNLAARLKS